MRGRAQAPPRGPPRGDPRSPRSSVEPFKRLRRRFEGVVAIAAVAHRAGVSTVSHALDGTRRVGAGTRASVVDAVEALRLAPDPVAQSPARASTDAVGIAVPPSAGSCFMGIVRAVETACRARPDGVPG